MLHDAGPKFGTHNKSTTAVINPAGRKTDMNKQWLLHGHPWGTANAEDFTLLRRHL